MGTKQLAAEEVFESVSKHMLVDVMPVIIDLDKSTGNRICDAKTGKMYLDCFSYIASNPIGHNHPEMFDKDFEKKLLRTSRSKPSNSDFYTVELAEFVEVFSRVVVPDYLKYLFFIEGGALAVENAMKTAIDWKVRKNISAGRSEDLGTKILHFKEAFHGRSGYTMSVTNTADPRKIKYYPKFDWPRIHNPKISFTNGEVDSEAAIQSEKRAEQEIREAFTKHANDIAGILIEPIQGEGGDNHFRAEFHKTLQKLAHEFDALLIYDEVQSGMGLTGKVWAHQHYGVEPDVVCFGKKSQVCGIIVGQRVEQAENHVFAEASRINSTWGGALADMVRCQRYLEIIEENNLIQNAAEVGSYLVERLRSLELGKPEIFSNARGQGLMAAIDAPTTEKRNEIFNSCLEHGLLILKCGHTTLRLRPSLTFSKEEVDELIEILDKVA